jgi:hypothetical protein
MIAMRERSAKNLVENPAMIFSRREAFSEKHSAYKVLQVLASQSAWIC